LLKKGIEMLKARDIMTKNAVSVKEDTPIYEAVKLLVKHNISGMPVVEDDMTLVGILFEKDLVILYYGNEEDERKTVGDFMTQPPIYFDENDSVSDVSDFLVKNIFGRVPITSGKKVVGIISIKNVLESII